MKPAVELQMTGEPLLVVENLFASYRCRSVLQNVSLSIWPQQVIAIVGLNGAGKTTILKAIGGLIRPVQGSIRFQGCAVEALPLCEIVRRGLIYVPEGMSVFPDMTVLENLEIGAYLNRRMIPERKDMVFGLFPRLYEARNAPAGSLSGGQQRMVTLGRGLMAGAQMLLLDDPFLGLSPIAIRKLCETFKVLRRSGVTLLIAGQHVRRILNVADVAFLVEDGAVTLSGPGPDMLRNRYLKEMLFGIEQ
jgi:branched-chain amino acid transport system ATP-binding protein